MELLACESELELVRVRNMFSEINIFNIQYIFTNMTLGKKKEKEKNMTKLIATSIYL